MSRKPAQTDEQRQAVATMARELRAARGWTQREAAVHLGISFRTYEEVERGQGFAYPTLLELAMRALATSRPPSP